MNESPENSQKEYFKFPNIEREEGEFDRVAKELGIETSVLMFLAQSGELVEMDEALLSKLENTDARTVQEGDWEMVHDNSNPDGVPKRNWEGLRNKLEAGSVLDAPIIMKFGERYHLVSGNTRLMVARAKGISPKVLLFEVDVQGK
jgi:hypothetical protein